MNNIRIRIGSKFRSLIRNRWERNRFNNPTVTIITNHCMGGIMSHDLGLRFNSPTVNMKIMPDDFIRFVENLEFYMGKEIISVDDTSLPYPVGMLGDVELWFVHYKTFDEAVSCWNRRKARMDWNNIRIMMTVREMCTNEILEGFEKLPYKKVAFANEPHREYPSVIFANRGGIPLKGYISDVVDIFGKRGYQTGGFDYIKFINK